MVGWLVDWLCGCRMVTGGPEHSHCGDRPHAHGRHARVQPCCADDGGRQLSLRAGGRRGRARHANQAPLRRPQDVGL
eukprot:958403-Pyramimonas_sp.AAC.1